MRTSVCICTRNRPTELVETIGMLARSSVPVDEVIVSDDSTSDDTREALDAAGVDVRYVRGPRIGLGANRNNAVDHATGDVVLFIDDDCHLGADFFEKALACRGDDERVIVTGTERNRGHLIGPAAQTFLGFQGRPYRPGEPLTTIVINATLFPRAMFDAVRFDPQLVYGYDEVDVVSRAVAAGYVVRLCPDAVNDHFPAPSNRELYSGYIDASRLYVTYKRYRYTDRRPLKAAAYLGAASGHLVAARLRRSGARGLPEARTAIGQATRYISAHRAATR